MGVTEHNYIFKNVDYEETVTTAAYLRDTTEREEVRSSADDINKTQTAEIEHWLSLPCMLQNHSSQ